MEQLTILDRAIRLQKVELFSELDTELLALIGSVAEQIRVEAGDTLIAQGGSLDALYVVLAGSIQMRRDGKALFTVGRGDTIGNWALFDRQPSVVTAVAVEQTWLLQIDREAFYDLLADHPEMTRELFFALFKRVRSLLSLGINTPSNPAS
ncbi:MAG: cyclic nucleotide-binding domain-containing protein [Acidobacteria bacterium]|nr:cyclic nucleotide-binding domain-containing protein [Acidobacteriota bacterium]